jgi:SAM-dependent methyltransferase
MQTMNNIDWNRAWVEDRKASKRANDQEYWNRRAPRFAQHVQEDDYNEYVVPFLRIMDAQPDWSVLDVGCGPGTLACPLSRDVRRVTAIDFSPAMIALLEARQQAAESSNIRTQVARWEDDWKALGIEQHDVAIASRSLGSDDPRTLLEKLMLFAKQSVYISCAVGEGPFDNRIFHAVGREVRCNPDYIYIYNLLHQMGIYAHVSLIEKQARTFTGEEEAVDAMRWMIENMTLAEEETLRRFISNHLIQDGQRWRLDYQRSVNWAVIWWKVSQQPQG